MNLEELNILIMPVQIREKGAVIQSDWRPATSSEPYWRPATCGVPQEELRCAPPGKSIDLFSLLAFRF